MNASALTPLRNAINHAYLADEGDVIAGLLTHLNDYDPVVTGMIARKLVAWVRAKRDRQTLVETMLHEYQLNTPEGIALMEIAEALLRIPDAPIQDALLREKLGSVDWGRHQTQHDTLLARLLTGALAVTGKIEDSGKYQDEESGPFLSRLSAPLIRSAFKQGMQHLAGQFVIAETIEQALQQARLHPERRYSFDMLGEAALTASDAERYYQAYLGAIGKLAASARDDDIYANPGISIKLSALYPRYEPSQHRRAVKILAEKLLNLAVKARDANITLTVDAEESERLEMSMAIFSAAFSDPALKDWPGLGLAVQAYQKRALPVIRWLAALAQLHGRKIPLRLVKGAYWDGEIKRAQENGLSNYPVFTRKTATDVSYLVCAQAIIAKPRAFYPQFATHNAHTVAAIYLLGKPHPGYEFQRLHGMGEQLYEELSACEDRHIPCRVYAPVGSFHELLPYLVRRLLENGANTSFINRIENPQISIDEIADDPVRLLQQSGPGTARIVLPAHLYGEQRLNSEGLNLGDSVVLEQLQHDLDNLAGKVWSACPLVNGRELSGKENRLNNPFDNRLPVGHAVYADPHAVKQAIAGAASAFNDWRRRPVADRSACLRKASELLEAHRLELISLCIREGGRTIRDALAEVREAVDFCRYYAAGADELFNRPLKLPGPTGEDNRLYQTGRGIFVCISPWNFPIAIFTGQIAAALAAGNTVIAKPASQTPLTAMRCIQLLHQAGIPEDVLQFLPGDGAAMGQHLLTDASIAGVVFTGSTDTARLINQQLAQHQQAVVPLIAETGGQNVLIADSSAHIEQLVQDAVQSAFNSAGQRCSALRVLFIQEDIADRVIAMLIGAMQQLAMGDPGRYATDIGPVIAWPAAKQLAGHVEAMRRQAKLLYQAPLDEALANGSFFPPSLIEISDLSQLEQEVFGPVLHLIRYRSHQLEQVIEAVNATGYGLTLGIHSRINSRISAIREKVRAGNIYINRNMIGAVVGVQPFGGMGLSGTGPKAGGPDYLRRFASEQTVTINTAAVGGNTGLLAQDLL